jgi:ubiquinone/menaquinone biosynthesis C-methylase UbiE
MSSEQDYYENPDFWRLERYAGADQERVATLADKLPREVRTLLDVGCGNGIFLKHLSGLQGRHFERLCGTDRSAAALARVQAEKVQASVDSLPFSSGEFDAVSCQEVLEHLPQVTYLCALNELSRIARQYIIVSVPFNEQLRMSLMECTKCACRFNPNYHLRSFTQATMQHLLDDKGFCCREVLYMHALREVPTQVEALLRLLGVAKRAVLRQPRSPMAVDALCPACGYSPRAGRNESTGSKVVPEHTVGTMIRSLLRVSSGWRWVGAFYERA